MIQYDTSRRRPMSCLTNSNVLLYNVNNYFNLHLMYLLSIKLLPTCILYAITEREK